MKTPTLREHVAIEAMNGLLSSSVLVNIDPKAMAKEAVALADALLEELGHSDPVSRKTK